MRRPGRGLAQGVAAGWEAVGVPGMMMVAAVTTLGSVSLGRRIGSDRAVGQLLAQQLMTEIVAKAYEVAGAANAVTFGSDSGDSVADAVSWLLQQ